MEKLSAVLSVLVAGLGQAYNRDFGKALVFFLLVYLSLLTAVNTQTSVMLGFALFIWVWSVFDAFYKGDFFLSRRFEALLSRPSSAKKKKNERLKRFKETQEKLEQVIGEHEKEKVIKKSPELAVFEFVKNNDSGQGVPLESLKELKLGKRVLFDAVDLLIDAGKLWEIEKNVFKTQS